MNVVVPQRRSDDPSPRRSNELLLALSRAQSRFISDADSREVFDGLLTAVLALTDSRYGFLAEVADPSSGAGALQVYAASDVEWDELYLDTLFNAAITTGQAVTFGQPLTGTEQGSAPSIRTFLGMPIHHHQELVGILGIANRPTGYDAATMGFLAPVVVTCGMLIAAARSDRRRHQAEHALRESEERFRAMADTAPVMVWMAGLDKGCTYFSRTWLEFTGRSMTEELGDGWTEGVHPDDYRQCLAQYGAAFEARQPFKMEYRLRRRDGEYRWILDTGVPRYCPEGMFIGYIGSCIDITERRNAEDALQRSEERYRGVVQSQTELICRFLPDTTLTFVNDAYARYFGRPADQLIGTLFLSLIPQEAHANVMRQLASFAPEQALRTYEHEVLRPDGSRGWQEWTDQAIFDEHGALIGFQSVGRDITDRKHTEEVLRRSEAALRGSQDELRLLAGRLLSAHEEERSALARELHDDLSQRLAALAIETAMLEVDCRSIPETALKRLRDIKDRLVNVSTDVHNISRQLHPAILQDLGLIDAVQSECVRFAEREGIQVEFVGKGVPDLPAEVAICLYRIAQEGLRNIAKHAKADEAQVTIFSEEEAVVLSIRDSGVGFDPASVRTSGGLGLASMRERAWLVRGDIAIRSRLGQGTTIEVRVPLGAESL